jgi:hypothetical protein
MIVFSFLLLNLTFRSTLSLSVYVSCYLLSAIESPSSSLLSYPNIPLFLYPRCSYLTDFFFCSYPPKISCLFDLDLDLFLTFAPCLALHPCSIYTYVLGLWGDDFDCIYFLDLMFVDRISCAVMASLVFMCEEESWG